MGGQKCNNSFEHEASETQFGNEYVCGTVRIKSAYIYSEKNLFFGKYLIAMVAKWLL